MTSSNMWESEKELLQLQQVDWSVDSVVKWHFAIQSGYHFFRGKAAPRSYCLLRGDNWGLRIPIHDDVSPPCKASWTWVTLATCCSEFGLQWPVPMISAGLSKPHLKMYRTLVAISTRFNSENSLVLNDNFTLSEKHPENRVQFSDSFKTSRSRIETEFQSVCFWILKLGVL